ncbi:DUF3990 domain-containing protein [Parabacteroides sp.]
MIVYHGGTDIITQPMVRLGRDKLDFGKGYYVTDILEQAETWSRRVADYRKRSPIVCKYELDLEVIKVIFRYKKFDGYNLEWLKFIVENRRGGAAWKDYDLIEGGVADDRVVDTVELFMGDYISAEAAIERLRHFAPNNQFCITNQQIAEQYLTFVESFIPKTK